MSRSIVLGIIPARYGSTRFPGKPLAKILGKTLIQRTYENAQACKALDKVVIATDDKRILEHTQSFGAEVVLTPVECPNGTDRLIHVIENSSLANNSDIIVNIQGDEPCIPLYSIEAVVESLQTHPNDVMATAVCQIHDPQDLASPSIVKCVFSQNGHALYFSRSPIPGNKAACYQPVTPYFRHLGLYAYRKRFLLHYRQLGDTPLQLSEDLEQLKVLEHGYSIRVVECQSSGIGIDEIEDIKKLEEWLCRQNTSL